MSHFKLKQPVKNKQPFTYWLFVALTLGFLVYMMIIDPALTWEFNRPGEISRLGYVLLTSGAFVTAGLAMIPVIRNDNAHEYALALIMANRNYMLHTETMALMDELTYHVFLKGNADKIVKKVQDTVDGHGGRDMRVSQYNMKIQFAEDLPLVSSVS